MICFSCLINVGEIGNLLLKFVIYMIFLYSFHVILALDEVMVEVISFGVRSSFFNYISVRYKYLMKNFVD